jgi:hypothetical protein
MAINLPKLNLPQFDFKFDESGNCLKIFDEFRKKYLVLTPEEWVRQNFVKFLVFERKYPPGLLKLEHKIKLDRVWKRCDIIIFDKSLKPHLIVECKATEVNISQNTINQIGLYNSKLKVKYLVATNGLQHICLQSDYSNNSFFFKNDIPFCEI